MATFSASVDRLDRSLSIGRAAMNRIDDRRDSGSATVLMITLCFTFLAGSLVWLSRTVDQSLDDRTNAAAIAFQAARAGAQAIDPDSARQRHRDRRSRCGAAGRGLHDCAVVGGQRRHRCR